MITYFVSADAVALGLSDDENCFAEILVNRCLEEHGIIPWEQMEKEIFFFNGGTLLIARPRAPRLSRINQGTPRLHRK